MASTSTLVAAAPTASSPAVQVRGLSVAYGRSVVLSRVTLSVPAGTLLAVVGPTGAGKTTLFRCLLGLVQPRAGDATILGESARRRHPELGYLSQVDGVDWRFPLTVRAAAMTGRFRRLGLIRSIGAQDRSAVERALELTGLTDLAEQSIGKLGLAERRRLALARALAVEPRLLLLDEPLQGLSGGPERALFSCIRQIAERGITTLVATRDPNGLAERFDRVALLNGHLIAEGPPGEVLTASQLDAAYGEHLVGLMVSARRFAVDA